MIEQWDEDVAPELQPCPAFGEPMVYDDGEGNVYPMCPTTGVFYAPPFSTAALLELLFPDNWSILPPT